MRGSHFHHIVVLPFSKFLEEQWRGQNRSFDKDKGSRRSSVGAEAYLGTGQADSPQMILFINPEVRLPLITFRQASGYLPSRNRT